MRVRAMMGDEKLLSHRTVKQRVVTDAWHHLRRAQSTAAVIAKQSPFSPSAVAKRRDAKTTVWAGGIPPGTDASAVEQLFQQFGRCDVTLRQKPTGESWAFVHFGSLACVAAVLESDLELSGVALSLRPVDVKLLEQKARGQRSAGMSSDVWETQNELQLDWSGVPLAWRRETDTIKRELVKFDGVVTKASNDAGTVDVWCSFQEGDADEAAAPRTLTDRFLRGGLVPGLRAFLLRPWTERLITAVIIFSLILTLHQQLIRYKHTRTERMAWHVLDWAICTFFVLEGGFKVLSFGLLGYLNSTWHRLDALITLATVLSTLSLDTQTRSNSPDHRYIVLFRMCRAARVFRLFRLLVRWDEDRSTGLIFNVTSHAAAALVDFSLYLFAIFYFAACIGITVFGGQNGLTDGHSKTCLDSGSMSNPVLKGSAYDGASYPSIGLCSDGGTETWGGAEGVVSSYYYGLNFDSISAAFVTLLHLLIMNNWHVTHEACCLVVESNAKLCTNWGEEGGPLHTVCVSLHSRWLVSCFFFAFMFCVPLVLVNILMSFFLDIFTFIWQTVTAKIESRTRKEHAQRSIFQVVEALQEEAAAKDGAPDPTGAGASAARRLCGCLRRKRTHTCAHCLLAAPAVEDVRATHVPLFVSSTTIYSKMAAFDEVNLCEACRKYWSAIEMLTARHGLITGSDKGVAEAMAQEDISAQREEMETKVEIVLRLGGGASPTVPLAAVRPRTK